MARSGRPATNDKIYNEELKRRFVEENYSNLGTRERYLKVFKRTFEFEDKLQKDIYNFNLEEIKDVLNSLSSVSHATVGSTKSILSKYINWAIREGLVNSVINVVDQYIDKDELSKMVSKLAQEFRFLKNKDELYSLINACENAQDAAIFVMSFYGLKAEDMVNLTIDDIEGNTIKVGSRKIELDERFMQVIHETYNQTIYVKNNGIEIKNIMSMEIALDTTTRHILHGTVNKNKTSNVLTKQVLNNRVKKVVSSLGMIDKYKHLRESFKLLTLGNVFYSGMFIHLYEIEQTKGLLESQDFINMREQYGLKADNWNDTKDRYENWKKHI